MEDTRKNVRSEYKMVGKWGFVPKLGAVLLAALIILSLASCKNSADGGVGYSDGGGAPVVSDSSGKTPLLDGLPDDDDFDSGAGNNRVTYTFHYEDGNEIHRVRLPAGSKFSEIKKSAGDKIKNDDEYFDGWKVDDSKSNATGEIITDDDMTFSESTKFVEVYRDKPKYKVGVSLDDLVSYGWYSSSTGTYLFFNPDGQEAYTISEGWTASEAKVKEFEQLDKAARDEFAAHGNSDKYKELKAEVDKKTAQFNNYAFYASNGEFNAETETFILFDFSTFSLINYKLNLRGDAILDENDTIVFRRVDE